MSNIVSTFFYKKLEKKCAHFKDCCCNFAKIQGVQDQNLPKEIGITKKLCTSDP